VALVGHLSLSSRVFRCVLSACSVDGSVFCMLLHLHRYSSLLWSSGAHVRGVKRIEADPSALVIDFDHAALIIIDMQRDFLEPGGFGETLGNDVSLLKAAVPPLRKVLDAARSAGMLVIHTREGHRPDLSDAPRHKVERGEPS